MICHYCSKQLEFKDKIYRQQICPNCDAYLHCCFNCRFYSEKAYHQCHEPMAEFVSDKTAANFCDYFEPGDPQVSPQKKKADDARSKLNDLFND